MYNLIAFRLSLSQLRLRASRTSLFVWHCRPSVLINCRGLAVPCPLGSGSLLGWCSVGTVSSSAFVARSSGCAAASTSRIAWTAARGALLVGSRSPVARFSGSRLGLFLGFPRLPASGGSLLLRRGPVLLLLSLVLGRFGGFFLGGFLSLCSSCCYGLLLLRGGLLSKFSLLLGLLVGFTLLADGNLSLLLDFLLAGGGVDGPSSPEGACFGVAAWGGGSSISGLRNSSLLQVQAWTTTLGGSRCSGRGRALRLLLRLWGIRAHVGTPLEIFFGGSRSTLRLLSSRRSGTILSSLAPRSRPLARSAVRLTTLAQTLGSGTGSATITRSRATFLRWQRSKRSASFPVHLTRSTGFSGRVTGRATLTLTTKVRTRAGTTPRQVWKRSLASPVAKVARGFATAAITTTSYMLSVCEIFAS